MSLSLVRVAVEEHIALERNRSQIAWHERHPGGAEKHLFVSDIGSCPRKTIWNAVSHDSAHQLYAEVTHPFSPYVQAIMRAGTVWEHETELALRSLYGDELQTQVPARNHAWSGRPDFVVPGLIIEHKATNPYNFKAKGRLPYRHHCLQVLLYQKLLDPNLDCQLYYRGWADWAEFAVWDNGDNIGWEGLVNGHYKADLIADTNLVAIMDHVETFWGLKILPPKYDSPTEHHFTCTRKTRQGIYPNCQFFGHCWPDLPQEGPWKANL